MGEEWWICAGGRKVGKEEKAAKGKGEVATKKTKKTKIKLNKRGTAGINEEKDRVRTGDYKKAVPCI